MRHFWTLKSKYDVENIYSFRPANAQGNIFSFDIKKLRGEQNRGAGRNKIPFKKKVYIYIYIYIILYNIIYILYYIILYYIGAGALYGDYRALQGHMFHTSYPSRRLLKHVTCSHVGMCGYARGGSGNTPRVVGLLVTYRI